MSERSLECDFCKDDLKWGATVCKGCGARIEYVDVIQEQHNSSRTFLIWVSGFLAAIPTFLIAIFAMGPGGDTMFWVIFLGLWLAIFVMLRRMDTKPDFEMVIPKFSRPGGVSVGVIMGGE